MGASRSFMSRFSLSLAAAAMGAIFIAFGCGGSSSDPTPPVTPTQIPVAIETIDGSDDVPTNAYFVRTFLEAMDTATCTATSFFIQEKLSAADTCDAARGIASTLDCTSATEWKLYPDAELAANTEYLICLTSGIKRADGQAIVAETYSFTTGSGTSNVAISPPSGATNVTLTAGFQISIPKTVTEPSDWSTVFTLKKDNAGGNLCTSYSSSIVGDYLIVVCNSAKLESGGSYTVAFSGLTGASAKSSMFTAITYMPEDINRDGYDDLLIGLSGADSERGAAYIYYGSATGIATVPDITFSNTVDSGILFGFGGGAGDLNGDGYVDLGTAGFIGTIISPGTFDFEAVDSYILFGGPNPVNRPSASADATVAMQLAFPSADFNNDGYDDLQAIYYDPVTLSYPYGCIIYGTKNLSGALECDVQLSKPDGTDTMPLKSGDINNDGYPDAIFGDDEFNSNQGRIDIYFGGETMSGSVDVTITGTGNKRFGQEAVTGDLNGDGVTDLAVIDCNTGNGGTVYLFLGPITEDLAANEADSIITTADPTAYFDRINTADLRNNGINDIMVGERLSLANIKAYMFYGSTTLPATRDTNDNNWTTTLSTESGPQIFVQDLNGNGYEDVCVCSGNDSNWPTELNCGVFNNSSGTLGTTAATTFTLPPAE